MLRKRSTRLAASAALVTVAALFGAVLLAPGSAGAGGAEAAASTKVTVGNNFFSPTAKTVAKGTRVKFKWVGGTAHDVKLRKGPGKKFDSGRTSARGVNLTKKFKKRGTYKIICSIHPDEMKLKLKVK